MPRAFRYGESDKQVTKLLRANGLFLDRRSKVVHNVAGELHLLLFGRDMMRQRERVHVPEGFQLHHRKSGTTGRCDCIHNLEVLTPEQHVARHGRTTRFQEVKLMITGPNLPEKRKQAADDFNELYPEVQR